MSVARVMGRDHWPTDCLAAGLLTLLSYAWFAALFRLQEDTIGNAKTFPSPIAAFTYRAVLNTFLITLTVVLSIWGIRELWLAV
jgi:hypothetical protein